MLPINDINKIIYYVDQCELNNLDVRGLRERIKNNEYERLPKETKDKLINNQENSIKDFIKNHIFIKNNLNHNIISEKILQQLILEDISSFLKELGNIYNYIDLLLFNYIYNCFVVVELKVTKLKKEHIGQIEAYMSYIDKHVKNIYHNKTIGIIITKYVMILLWSIVQTKEYTIQLTY